MKIPKNRPPFPWLRPNLMYAIVYQHYIICTFHCFQSNVRPASFFQTCFCKKIKMARKRTCNGGIMADDKEIEETTLEEQKPPTTTIASSISAPDPDAITPVRSADKMVQRKTFCLGPGISISRVKCFLLF